jgi:NAD(P)-dependent dehydrogenase (short-subunit alcohol dehydrogenase family)
MPRSSNALHAAALPMLQRKQGAIVNTASVAGLVATPGCRPMSPQSTR